MATDLCFYFQVHQPWRLRQYRFREVGRSESYFDEELNATILRKVANKCYLPMNNLLLDLIQEHGSAFKAAFSITGTVLQQMEEYAPEVIPSFKRLFETGQVELLSETSHHSLAALHSPEEFREQIAIHRQLCTRLLVPPSRVFRNTELISSSGIARQVQELGFEGMLMESADHIMRRGQGSSSPGPASNRSPLFKYRMKGAGEVVALLRNYRLSDDIAFRFSDRDWAQWPLTSEKFAQWIRFIDAENPVAAQGGNPFVGLFMDYETFGEHQWEDTGIFDFMRALPGKLLKRGFQFVTPTEAVSSARQAGMAQLHELDAPEPFSWADSERDLSAWQGNGIQDSSLRAVHALEKAVKEEAEALGRAPGEKGAQLLETWRRLTTSDHFYYMCTKYFNDGDVHKYFSPYESPYDAHILFMNVIADMERRVKHLHERSDESERATA
ncbi:MAG: alpha-amylase [Methylotenera sp.]|nr:alpha-amylase [Oligoflexia bacterium]